MVVEGCAIIANAVMSPYRLSERQCALKVFWEDQHKKGTIFQILGPG